MKPNYRALPPDLCDSHAESKPLPFNPNELATNRAQRRMILKVNRKNAKKGGLV